MMLKGAFTALITPFNKEQQVDIEAFQQLIEWQIAQGIHGLVPCGTTGESPTLTHEEHDRVIEVCVEAAKGRVPVMAGTGSNSTQEAIRMTLHAEKVGADAALIVSPYYNKPTQEGIYQHFKAIHDAVGIPLIVYNIPGRSVIDIKDETMLRLAKLPRIKGIKDATGDLARVGKLRGLLIEQGLEREFSFFSGEDATVVGFNAEGGQGVISVTANIAPKQVATVQQLTLDGKFKEALRLQDTLQPLHQVMFCETSPGPVKYAASLIGKSSAHCRLPLVLPTEAHQQQIEAALKKLNLC